MHQKTIKLFKRIAKLALQPLPNLSVSDWADNYRMLSAEASAEPGRWRTDRAPYQREIMNAFTQYKIWKIAVMSASQIGKSDIMNNVIGRYSHIAPAPIMMIQPTIEMAQDYSKSRIAPMIRDTKVLREIYRDVKTRETGNTILSKIFPGGRLIMGGANSPAGLASRPIKILLADEVDRFPDSAGTEGDPVDLAAKRMTTFWDKRLGLFSTPTIAGESRIEEEYLQGTQEEWQHECPNCHEYHLLTHRQMVTDHQTVVDKKGNKHATVHSVKWRCPDCGFSFTEEQMRRAPQKFVAQNASALAKGVRSFFVNCWTSPWLTWAGVMQEWLEAEGDPEREKVVVNTRFGEPYERKGAFESIDKFLQRREPYGAELPDGVLILTAAVDVQDNRLEYEICGWGKGEECWGIKKGIILGVPENQEVWAALDEQLDREYRFKNGTGLIVPRTFIDSGGHYTKEVYVYSLRRLARQCFAVKGASTAGVPIIHKYAKVTTVRGRTIPLVLIGTDSGKQYVMDRLSISVPGPKYFHFPLDKQENEAVSEILWNRGYDDIYFRGLIAEQKVAHKKNGRVVWQWENIAKDKRNEPLDLRVYNLACLHSMNVDWEQLEQLVNSGNIDEKPQKSALKVPKTAGKRSFGCIKRGLRGDF
ncbi:phage terminase large subunit family protein [Phascolarctobacterium faecium]|nr:terminase gpA endonuclease subunit [Phascolarctobacterium faecium]MDM8108581.1 phage terminase large subunit family protein [Phascolarctobacterium faecium]